MAEPSVSWTRRSGGWVQGLGPFRLHGFGFRVSALESRIEILGHVPFIRRQFSDEVALKPTPYLFVVPQIRELNNPTYLMTASRLFQVRQHEFTAGKCSCGDWW